MADWFDELASSVGDFFDSGGGDSVEGFGSSVPPATIDPVYGGGDFNGATPDAWGSDPYTGMQQTAAGTAGAGTADAAMGGYDASTGQPVSSAQALDILKAGGAIATLAGAIIKAGSPLASALIGMGANNRATSQILAGNQQAIGTILGYNQTALAADAAARGSAIQTIGTSRDAATGQLAPIAAAGDPATSYLRTAMTSDPSRLTPAQQIGLSDLQRQVGNQLSISGMRGSGYGGAAVLADATQRMRAGDFAQNLQRADSAASSLNSAGNAARSGIANTQIGTGSQIAQTQVGGGQNAVNLAASTGRAISNIQSSTGGTRAANTVANANQTGALISGVGNALSSAPAVGSAISRVGSSLGAGDSSGSTDTTSSAPVSSQQFAQASGTLGTQSPDAQADSNTRGTALDPTTQDPAKLAKQQGDFQV